MHCPFTWTGGPRLQDLFLHTFVYSTSSFRVSGSSSHNYRRCSIDENSPFTKLPKTVPDHVPYGRFAPNFRSLFSYIKYCRSISLQFRIRHPVCRLLHFVDENCFRKTLPKHVRMPTGLPVYSTETLFSVDEISFGKKMFCPQASSMTRAMPVCEFSYREIFEDPVELFESAGSAEHSS